MARKKLKLEFITNNAARRATFKKRGKGIMKKVSELSTLCDVRACLIVYGHGEAVPEVWPSVPEAARVLAKLKRMPEMEQSRKMMDQEGLMRQRIAKLQEQLRKQDRENRELEATLLMRQCLMEVKGLDGVGTEEVTRLAWMIEMKANEAKKKIEGWSTNKPCSSKEMPATKEGKGVVKEEVEKSAMEVAMEELQRQEWFTHIINPASGFATNNSSGCEVMGSHHMEHTGNNSCNYPWFDASFPLN